jgi:hypothetical protein
MNIHEMANKYAHLKDKMEKTREKGQEIAGHLLQSAEVIGGSALIGYMDGRNPNSTKGPYHEVVGVPTSLLTGFGGHAAAFLGGFGKYDEHVHNLADGFLAAFTYRAANKAGTEARTKSLAPQTTRGMFGPTLTPQNYGTVEAAYRAVG